MWPNRLDRHYSVFSLRGLLLAFGFVMAALLNTAAVWAADAINVSVIGNAVQVQTQIAHERSVLRVAGPEGYALTSQASEPQGFREVNLLQNASPRMSQNNPAPQPWDALPAGTYYYEVVLYAGEQSVSQVNGQFVVGQNDQAYKPMPRSAVGNDGALASSPAAKGTLHRMLAAILDFIVPSAHADTFTGVTIQTLDPYLYFDSTWDTGNNWQIYGYDLYFKLNDVKNSSTPLTIYPGSGNNNALYVSGTGNVGIGTASPQAKFHVNAGNLRMSPSGGDVWDLNPGTTGFWFNNVTDSQSGVLRLDNDALANSIVVKAAGVGMGTATPARQLHMSGSNAVFRMDRSTDTAAFMIVRTNASNTPLKSFVVGVNAAGANDGEFVINDLGSQVGGAGSRRMTINTAGNVAFTGTVSAVAYSSTSSARYKKNVETLTKASQAVEKLRGVRFDWKDNGKQSIGLIAEEVAKVFPELVEFDKGQANGVNYPALVAVLVEALKEQQAKIDTAKEQQQAELRTVTERLVKLERLLSLQQASLRQ